MKQQMIKTSDALQCPRMVLAMALSACTVFMSGCEDSLGGRPDARLTVGQANEPGLTAAIAGGSSTKQASPKTAGFPQTVNAFASATTPGNSAYKIGALDVLEISVFKVPELSKSVQVSDSGTVNFALVGEVPASGKTAQELERDLTAKLGSKYLRNPQVNVYVKEYNSQRATIEGAVKRPGVYPIKGKTSLVQFIAMAEGLDRDTASNDVIIFRMIDGKRSAARFDIDEIRQGGAEDPLIQQADVIIVDSSTSRSLFNNVLKVLPVTATFIALL